MLTITELLVDNASVPAGGPFIFFPLVDSASVPAGEPFIFCSAFLDVTADVSLQVWHCEIEVGNPHVAGFFFSVTELSFLAQ